MFYLNFLFKSFSKSVTNMISSNTVENYLKFNNQLPLVPFYSLAKLYTKHSKKIWETNKNSRMSSIELFNPMLHFWLSLSYSFIYVLKQKDLYVMYVFMLLCDKYNFFDGCYMSPATRLSKEKTKSKTLGIGLSVLFKSTLVFNSQLSNKYFYKAPLFFKKFNNFFFSILFKPSSLMSLYSKKSLNNLNMNFLSKNKVFNKGRYSSNSQYYSTGVYWCLYMNIIAVLGFYFWFYKLTFNFGYLWWLLWIFMASFFVPSFLKYNSFSIVSIMFNDFFWFMNLLPGSLTSLRSVLAKLFFKQSKFSFFYFKLFIS